MPTTGGAIQLANVPVLTTQPIPRLRPSSNDAPYGFPSLNSMLEAAHRPRSLALERDENSGGYIVRLAGGEE